MTLGSSSASAVVNPDKRWRQAESENFIAIYAAGHGHLAQRVLFLAERAYVKLSIELGHRLRGKIVIALTDPSDFANGSANTVPYAHMRLHMVAPGSQSTLASYDDWLDILVTHELSHIVHLDIDHGLPRVVNRVLSLGMPGKSWPPNRLIPRWLVEGLATYHESKFTSQGRLRASTYDMYLRMATLEGRLSTLDQVGGEGRVWPFAGAAYLYGSYFVRYIADRFGAEELRHMFHRTGADPRPYDVDRMFRASLGVDAQQLWREFCDNLYDRYRAQARAIRARGLRQGLRLTAMPATATEMAFARDLQWSQDGTRFYFLQSDAHSTGGLATLNPKDAALREGQGPGSAKANPGVELLHAGVGWEFAGFIDASESQFVVAERSRHDDRYAWGDLFARKVEGGGQPRQLTFGMRAAEPSVSPDGKRVAFVHRDAGQMRLAVLDLSTLEVVQHRPHDPLQQIHDPAWSPDSQELAYVAVLPGGYRDIVTASVDGEVLRWVTADRHAEATPHYSPDGRYLLFTSDRGGVFNVYAYDRHGTGVDSLKQVTNLLGGAQAPAVSPDGKQLAYIGYTATGYDLWVMDFDPERFLPALPSSRPLPLAAPPYEPKSGDAGLRSSTRYRAGRSLHPWSIAQTLLGLSAERDAGRVTLGTTMTDYAEIHQITARVGYDRGLARPYFGVGYHWRRPLFGIDFGFSHSMRLSSSPYDWRRSQQRPWRVEFRQGQLVRSTTLSTGLAMPVLRRGRHGAFLRLGYTFRYFQEAGDVGRTIDVNAPAPRAGWSGRQASASLEFEYNNSYGSGYGSYAESGRHLFARVQWFDKALGGETRDFQGDFSYTEHLRMPWHPHHVLGMRALAGLSAAARTGGGGYSLGGDGDIHDYVMAIIRASWAPRARVFRGYPHEAFRAANFALLKAEYRFPVIAVERGLGHGLAFLRRIDAYAFTDWGLVSNGDARGRDLLGSVGGGLTVRATAVYARPLALTFEYAHGLDAEFGIDRFQIWLGSSF